MMTINNLVKVYHDTYKAQPYSGVGHFDLGSRAGIAAVVRALRDEFGRIMYPGDDWNRQGILEQFDQILGDAGSEKVADTVAQAAEPRLREVTGASPVRTATDPAPAERSDATAVCVWHFNLERSVWRTGCGQYYGPFQAGDKEGAKRCHHCFAPIKFTEAKT